MIDVFGMNAPRLQRLGRKAQVRYPRGSECQMNVLMEAVRGQFRSIGQSVAIEIRDGLRGNREWTRPWRGIIRGSILSGIPSSAYFRRPRHYRHDEQKRQL